MRAEYRKTYEILREDVPGLGLYQAFASYGARKLSAHDRVMRPRPPAVDAAAGQVPSLPVITRESLS